ncbi:ImmA/IrrE family metallo-endopeptidase [Sphingomonas gei]|uniref:ImmA/IrrE family metallo-endopeptidase n=1 Tax=Sphingomonas gei TaxID=1395960 RepID=A0A4S1X981_9SPHN|nr:ImmA/IrrE family metallo-endopeptidase [Sphingomonas gei]TGX52651.1 ImmA/IrrE family metallo-endopeptidase [Sphingomonas gei]
MPQVEPEILRWARETAGYDLVEAARRIQLNATKASSGADRLAALEAGEGEPSTTLLNRMAKQYRRPLLTFYLPQVPRKAEVGQDFRTLPEQGDPANSLLDALLRDIKARQALVRELLEDDDETDEVGFVASQQAGDSVTAIADTIVEGIAFDRALYRAAQTRDAAFAYLRACAERAGVYVLLAGSLGSWQTAIEVSVFRGFAIADRVAPFVVVNDQDAKSAWSFTLLHELAHLCIGATGVSGGTMAAAGIERLCNEVAAAILVDDAEIAGLPIANIRPAINAAANQWRVSRSMVAYRLRLAGRITEARWRELTDSFRHEWLALRANERAANREREGGPSYYTIRRHRVGAALLSLVKRGIREGSVTPVRAAKMLGVKPMAVYSLIGDAAHPVRAA